MERAPRTKRLTRHAQSLPNNLRQFLTPTVWKQAQRGLRKPRKDALWNLHHLVLVRVARTWSRRWTTTIANGSPRGGSPRRR